MFKFDNEQVIRLRENIQKAENIVILGHTSPDGDAVASVLSLYLSLRKITEAKIYPIVPDEPPNYVMWFKHIKDLRVDGEAAKWINKADLIFCLDFNEFKRVNHLMAELRDAKAIKILIDHHPDPKCNVDFMFSYPQASSTAEIVYFFIKSLGDNLLDLDIATYIFSGILTDTGIFIHDSADYLTLNVASELMSIGVNKGEVIKNLYNNYSADRMRMMGYLLYKKMRLYPDYEVAVITLSRRTMDKFNFKFGDHENIVNLPLSIKEVELSILIMEIQGKVKLSFRSKGKYNVSLIAREYFSGGGHKNAAGGSFDKSINKARKYLEENVFPNLKNYLS